MLDRCRADKILNLKLFESLDGEGKLWKSSVTEQQGEVLLVSQFTLYATIKSASGYEYLVLISRPRGNHGGDTPFSDDGDCCACCRRAVLFRLAGGNKLDFHKAMPPGQAKEFYAVRPQMSTAAKHYIYVCCVSQTFSRTPTVPRGNRHCRRS